MEAVFTWIGIALAALVVVAVSVAAWETYRLTTGRLRASSEPPPANTPLAAVVDVDVDKFANSRADAPGDSADRRATLEQAMGRLSQTPGPTATATATATAAPSPATAAPPAPTRVKAVTAARAPHSRPMSWVDTEPMVGPGARAEPPRAPSKAHNA